MPPKATGKAAPKATGKAAPKGAPAPTTAKASKAAKKADREAAEAQRLRERDSMMPPSESEEEEESEVEDVKHGKPDKPDKPDKPAARPALASKQTERERAIAERERVKAEAEAKAVRASMDKAEKASKSTPAAGQTGGYPSTAAAGRATGRASQTAGAEDDDDDDDMDAGQAGGSSASAATRQAKAAAAEAKMLQKVEKGEKLSNKERRAYEKWLQQDQARREEESKKVMVAEEPPEVQKWIKELDPFQIHLPSDTINSDGEAAASGGGASASISIKGFGLSAPGSDLLVEADLVLARGKRYGLLGPNGMGKTTLLKCLATRRLPLPAGWTVGLVSQEAAASNRSAIDEVLSANVERSKLMKEETDLLGKLEDSAGCAAEEIARLCERLEKVSDALEASGAESDESRVRQILLGLQFTEAMMTGSVENLSGGWRMRVSLAKALYLAPDLLLLDEPTNHLDLDAVLWLDEFLSEEFKNTLLVVSHDADFLDSICTNIYHLEDRKLNAYKGGYTEFKKRHAERRKHNEKEYKKLVDEAKKATGSKARMVDKEELEKAKPSGKYVVKFNFLPLLSNPAEVGISLRDVSSSYSGSKPWLLGPQLDFRIIASDRIALGGKNGAGKSTLLNLMTKTVWPSEGEDEHTKGLTIGRYSQHFEELKMHEELTPVELLTHPDVRRNGLGIENPQKAHQSLGQFGLPSNAHTRQLKVLSGGQKARVQFALLTCRRPELLVLDEPTNHLDIESVEEFIEALNRYKGGFVLVSHDARLISTTQAQIWEVDGSGSYKDCGEGLQGFQRYRQKVLTQLERQRMEEAARGKQRDELRRQRRAEALAKRKP